MNRSRTSGSPFLWRTVRCSSALVLIFGIAALVLTTRTVVSSGLLQNAQSDSGELPSNLLQQAEALRSQQNRESNQAAVQKYLEASGLLRVSGQWSRAAEALTMAGEIYEGMGDLKNALLTFRDALDLSRKANSVLDEGKALNGLASVYFLKGESSAAYQNSLKALDCADRVKDDRLKAAALTNLGESVFASGDLQTAQRHQLNASELWKALGDRRGLASSQIALGYYSVNLSDPQKALAYLESALRLAEEAGDIRSQAIALNATGNVKSKLGRKQEALNAFAKAKPLAERIGDRLYLASILAGTGSVYYWLGDAHLASQCDEQAVRAFEEIGALWGIAETKLDLGRINNALGNHEKSISYLEEALVLFRDQGMRRLEAQALREIGIAESSSGEYSKSLQTFRQSIKLSRLGQDYRYEAYAHDLMGRDYEKLNDYEHALQNYREALKLSRIASDPLIESLSLTNIARVERDQGSLAEAQQEIEEALKLGESIRGEVTSQDLRASYLATIHQIYELYIDVLMLRQKESSNREFGAQAFAISEQARARSLLESLQEGQANIRAGVDASLLEKERSLREQLNIKADRQVKLLAAKNSVEAEMVKTEIDALTAEYARVHDQIRAASPRYAALISPELLNLEQVQHQILDEETVLLEYSLGDDRSYVWLITAHDFSSFELAPAKEVELAARQFYSDITAYQLVPEESVQERTERQKNADNALPTDISRLSKLVLRPLAGKLGNKRLLVVSDGALQYVPFASLYDPDGDPTSPQYLSTKHQIVREPSASTLGLLLNEARQRTSASYSVAVFADPVFEVDDPRVKRASYASTPESSESLQVKQALRDIGISPDGVQIPRLIASRDEADAIISSAPWGTGLEALGFEANRGRILGEELGRYRVVHFATHGMINNEHPELSGIVFSLFDQQGRSQDGFLRLHDIYNLHLPADLVVLSACSTGLGKDVRGEGLVGLTRGFMYAGASGVVASLWKVDDRATAELMKRFYDGMFRKGLPPDAALRKAQLELSQQKAWQSPYYWAGFIIQGRYDEQLNVSSGAYLKVYRIPITLVLLAVGLVSAVLLVRRRRSRVI